MSIVEQKYVVLRRLVGEKKAVIARSLQDDYDR